MTPTGESVGREPDDQRLVERIRTRDAGALATLFRHYYPRVYHFAMRRLGRPGLAETVTGEVFFEAWQSVEAFRGGSAVSSWLYGIAHFKCTGARHPRGRTQRGRESAMAAKCPEGVLTLIPWYRELDADDRGVVEAHAAGCASCRSEVEMVAGGAVPPTPFPDRDAAFSKLMARIEHAGRYGREEPAKREGWRIAGLAAAALLLVFLGFALAQSIGGRSTLTAVSVSSGPPYSSLHVVFRDGVSAAQIEHALARVDAVLVSGPNAGGRYLVAVPPGVDPRRVAGILMAGTHEHPHGVAKEVAPRSH